MGSRGAWLSFFILFCGTIYYTYLGEIESTITLSAVVIIFLLSSFLRVKSFGGTNKTLWWILFPPVFLLACLFMKRRSINEKYSANTTIINAFLTVAVSTFVIGLLSVALIGAWTDRRQNIENITTSEDTNKSLESPSYELCYKRGIEYFASIGVVILTSPPDEGKFATDVAAERCRRSALAFGR